MIVNQVGMLVILIPLLGFVYLSICGRYLGHLGSIFISIGCMLVNVILTVILVWRAMSIGIIEGYKICSWIELDLLSISWEFLYDSLTLIMLLIVNLISLLVHIYAIGYLSNDPHLPRFLSYLLLFTLFMLILITAGNFLQLFLGWEGVGLCSYLLISFWFTRIQANKAALKAMIMNRIGDIGLLLGIVIIVIYMGSINFAVLSTMIPYCAHWTINFLNMQLNIITLLCFLLFIGATGKSAQIILHTWLPDAMEGPTPVSALIHAATMVTAGIFLIIRSSILFEYATITSHVTIMIIGSLTAVFGATTGFLQYDLKKIIAYSTCSQLGYMILCRGLSSYSVSLYHLTNHAFFKALLFLGSGAIIHAVYNNQDIRKLGRLSKILPYTYFIFIIGSFALMGFPFMSGFYSKDFIIEILMEVYTELNRNLLLFSIITVLFTALYSTRLLYLTFYNITQNFTKVTTSIHEMPVTLWFSLLILASGSIFSGQLLEFIFSGIGNNFFTDIIIVKGTSYLYNDSEFLPSVTTEYSLIIKIFPLLFTLLGSFAIFTYYIPIMSVINELNRINFAQYQYLFLRKKVLIKYYFLFFLNTKWLFDKIYNITIAEWILREAYFLGVKTLDKGFFELFGPLGLCESLYTLSLISRSAHSGYIWHYVGLLLLSGTWIVLISQSYNLIFI